MNRKFFVVTIIFALLLAACAQEAAPGFPETELPPTEATTEPVEATPGDSGVSDKGPILDETPLMNEDTYAPKPGDENLKKANASVDSSELLILESFPQQYQLQLAGTLPTPCHQLRIERVEGEEPGTLALNVYSLVDPDQICTQVLQPFEVTVPLQQIEPGQQYSIKVNGEQVAEITP